MEPNYRLMVRKALIFSYALTGPDESVIRSDEKRVSTVTHNCLRGRRVQVGRSWETSPQPAWWQGRRSSKSAGEKTPLVLQLMSPVPHSDQIRCCSENVPPFIWTWVVCLGCSGTDCKWCQKMLKQKKLWTNTIPSWPPDNKTISMAFSSSINNQKHNWVWHYDSLSVVSHSGYLFKVNVILHREEHNFFQCVMFHLYFTIWFCAPV